MTHKSALTLARDALQACFNQAVLGPFLNEEVSRAIQAIDAELVWNYTRQIPGGNGVQFYAQPTESELKEMAQAFIDAARAQQGDQG